MKSKTLYMISYRLKSTHTLTYSILAFFSLILSVWMWCAYGQGPGWSDDMAYNRTCEYGMGYLHFFPCSGHPIHGIADSLHSIIPHIVEINARLANVLMYFFILLPVWLRMLLHGVAMLLLLCGVMRLALGKGWKDRPLVAACAGVLMWVMMPWWDMECSSDFIINYVWTSAMDIWVVIAVFTPYMCRRLRWLWLAVPAALMHEGIAASVDAGIGLYMILHYQEFKDEPRRFVVPIVYILVSFLPLLSPGRWEEVIIDDRNMWRSADFYVNKMLMRNFVPLLILLWYGIVQWRRHHQWEMTAIYMVWIASAFFVCYVGVQVGRVFWAAYLISVVMICTIAGGWHISRVWLRVSALSVIMAISGMWAYQLFRWQIKLTAERDAARAELVKGHPEGKYVLTHITEFQEVPWWLLGLPHPLGDIDPFIRYQLNGDVHDGKIPIEEGFAFLPEAPTLEQSIESLPRISDTMRGNLNVIVSTERVKTDQMVYTLSEERFPDAPGFNPIYALRRQISPLQKRLNFEQYALCLSSGDTVYVIRPLQLPQSLWGRKLLKVRPVTKQDMYMVP